MGLDMYLTASKYIGDWNHDKPDSFERIAYKDITKALGMPDLRCSGSPHLTVRICVAYWRKANQIHKWFVDKVQGGKDECQESYVSREQLQELVDLCKKVLANPYLVGLLPPASGFFFGSTEIDEWYWDGLKSTVEQLTAVLENPKLEKWGFDYCSSW